MARLNNSRRCSALSLLASLRTAAAIRLPSVSSGQAVFLFILFADCRTTEPSSPFSSGLSMSGNHPACTEPTVRAHFPSLWIPDLIFTHFPVSDFLRISALGFRFSQPIHILLHRFLLPLDGFDQLELCPAAIEVVTGAVKSEVGVATELIGQKTNADFIGD